MQPQIQTRQYRSPEVILGKHYNQTADIWSLACMLHELLVTDFLFGPTKVKGCTKSEMHLSLMMSYLQQFPSSYSRTGIYSKSMVLQSGDLRHLELPNFRHFETVLVSKYNFTLPQAKMFADFTLKMLNIYPELRPSAFDMMKHPWMQSSLRDFDHIIRDEREQELAKDKVRTGHLYRSDPIFHRELKKLEEEDFFADQDRLIEDELLNDDVGWGKPLFITNLSNSAAAGWCVRPYFPAELTLLTPERDLDVNRVGMDADFTPMRTGFDEGIDIASLDITGNAQFM